MKDIIKEYEQDIDQVIDNIKSGRIDALEEGVTYFIKFKDNVDISKLPMIPTSATSFEVDLDDSGVSVAFMNNATILNPKYFIQDPVEFLEENREFIDFIF